MLLEVMLVCADDVADDDGVSVDAGDVVDSVVVGVGVESACEELYSE